jgi:hypothetical protein
MTASGQTRLSRLAGRMAAYRSSPDFRANHRPPVAGEERNSGETTMEVVSMVMITHSNAKVSWREVARSFAISEDARLEWRTARKVTSETSAPSPGGRGRLR